MIIKQALILIGKLLLIAFMLIILYPVGYFVLDSQKNPYIPLDDKNTPHKKDIISYIINLDSSKERYDYVKDSIMSLGFPLERISAVNGSDLSEEEINSVLDAKSYKSYLRRLPKKGTIGCSLSHIKTWEKFLESNYEFAIIFEDDVSFDANKLRIAIQELIENHHLWDINIFEIFHRGLPLTVKQFNNSNKLVVYLTEVSHSGAYIINRKAARNLYNKSLPIKMPIDHYFTRSWELDLKFTGIENPRLVYQSFGDSDIETTKNISDTELTLLESLHFNMYKLQSYIIRFVYNLKLYLFS